MPSISTDGKIAMRRGSVEWPVKGAWIDLTAVVGEDIAIADGWWCTDDSLCYVKYGHVYTVNLHTFVVTDWGLHQGNSLYSGGGVWAAGGAYYDSWGPNPYFGDQSGWVPYAVDNLTGQIAVLLPDWQFCVYQGHVDPSQARLTAILSGVTEYQASFANGVLTVYQNGNWYHWTREAGLTLTGSLNRTQADPGGRFCHEWNLDGTGWYGQVIWSDWHPQQAVSIGWVYNYNAKVWRETPTSAIVQVIGSRGPGELTGEQQVFTVNLDLHTLDGRPWTLVDMTQPPPPDPPVPPIPPIPPIPPQPPVVVETDMTLPILEAGRFIPTHPTFPDRWSYHGADGRVYGVNDTGQVYWNAFPTSPDSSFTWTSGAKTYTAPRNGVSFEGKVA